MILGVLFVVCLITSNLLETKIVSLFGLTFTAGMIVFPISYIINDCIAEVWGFKKARFIIWIGFAMNFLVILFGWIAMLLPGAYFWEGEESFNMIFSTAPRIAFASLCAFWVGSFFNAYIMSKMKIASKGRNFSLRAIVSTLVEESADSLLFFPIAFGGIVPVDELLKIMGLQIVLKSLYEVLVLPLTILVVNYIKRVEQTDVYDEKISYNFFRIKDV